MSEGTEETTTDATAAADDQQSPEELREHIQSSLGAADGDVSALTGQEDAGQTDAGASPVAEKLEEVKTQAQDKVEAAKAQAQEKVEAAKGQAQAKLSGAQEAISGKSEDLLGKAKGFSPQSVVQQAWELGRGNPVPVAVGGAFLAGVAVGRRSVAGASRSTD
ncbi:MAG: hypothetical protein QOF77_1400 [Solirubrobacteraceae bacterium]|nr:hypothetical protein [Solirubrobacteraceae bacterium]